ncbi:MAG: hypothetical protein ACI9XK_004872 [Granulosicoccus sp.]|jgi:hypothetical protein
MSEDKRVLNNISPIQINNGKAVNAQFQLASHRVLAMIEPTGTAEKSVRAAKPTAISVGATQRPLARRSSIRANSTIEIALASIVI